MQTHRSPSLRLILRFNLLHASLILTILVREQRHPFDAGLVLKLDPDIVGGDFDPLAFSVEEVKGAAGGVVFGGAFGVGVDVELGNEGIG